MHLIIKFKNNGLLFYYFLFLFILGSCTYSSGGGELSEEGDVEEIDENPDEKKGDNLKNTDTVTEMPDENEDHPDIFDEDVYDDSEMEFDDDNDADEPDFPDISGKWVKLMIFSGKAKPPIIDPLETRAVMVLKVDIDQNGSEIISFNEMCRLKVGVNSLVIAPIVPDSFAQALPIVEKKAYLTEDEEGNISLYQPKTWEVRACYLDDPENEPLPTKENAPNVFDPDNTSINGILMFSKGVVSGSAEIVQKVSTELNGFINKDGNISGIVTWFEYQKVLWTDNDLMWDGVPTYPHGDPNDSVFIYKRIDPSWDCDMIREKSAELFPEYAEMYPEEFK